MIIEVAALLIAIIIFLGAYVFYNSKNGSIAVYQSEYAFWIDLISFISGYIIFTVSLLLYINNWPLWIILPLYISGCLQALMHIAKFLVRNKRRKDL